MQLRKQRTVTHSSYTIATTEYLINITYCLTWLIFTIPPSPYKARSHIPVWQFTLLQAAIIIIIIIWTFITRKLIQSHECAWQQSKTEQISFQFTAKSGQIISWKAVPWVGSMNSERPWPVVRRGLWNEQHACVCRPQVLPTRQQSNKPHQNTLKRWITLLRQGNKMWIETRQ